MNTIPLTKELIDSQNQLDALRAEYNVIQDKLRAVAKDHAELFSNFALEAFEAAKDKLAHILSPQFYDVSVDHLRATDRFMWDTYNTRLNGYNSLTLQRLPQLTFKKGDDAHNEKMRRLIEDALPHMIPFAEGMKYYNEKPIEEILVGFCLFDILEHGLSERAAINVYFSHDKKVLVSSTRYGRVTYSKVMNFDEGIDYIIKNHYYESLDPADNERDDD